MRVLLLALLIGCGPAAYAPRGIVAEHHDVDARTFRSLGCLEVAFGARPPVHHDDAALLVTRFGNTCLHPTPFDLRSVRITGIDSAGHSVSLTLVDPRDEVQLLHLDAGARGIEKVRLHADTHVEVRTLCLDLTAVSPGSQGPPGPPFCLEVT